MLSRLEFPEAEGEARGHALTERRRLRWLTDSILEKQQDVGEEWPCAVLCSDNDILAPAVAQKQQGRNDTMWTGFMGISATKAPLVVATWAFPNPTLL